MKKIIFTSLFLLLAPNFVFANQYFSVTPVIIDQKSLVRGVLEETITITNTGTSRLNIYTFVNNIDVEDGEKDFQSRSEIVLAESLANWIEISRGTIEISGGESVEIPVTINVNLRAKPGVYHALISFSRGSSRAQAEERIDFGSSVVVNVEVTENVRERLQLDSFVTNKIFFGGDDISFSYNLENIGNKDLQPIGEVRIYDKKGREVGAVPANVEGTTIEPSAIGQIASVWNAGKSFGKYKALLDVEYGSSQIGTVNDTIYFWIIPWKQLLVIFLLLASVVGGGTYFLYQRYEKRTQPAYAHSRAQKYRKFDEDSLLIPQHSYQNGEPKQLTDDHLLNLRS